MRNCDIKFVNKEITPFGGLSLFFKMLEPKSVIRIWDKIRGTLMYWNPSFTMCKLR